ncbi:MAG: O-antigen polymerase [Bacillota bacterium]
MQINKVNTNRNNHYVIYISLIIFIMAISLFILVISGNNTSYYKPIVLGILLFCIYKGFNEKSIINPYFLFSIVPFSLLIYSPEISNVYLLNLTNSTIYYAIFNMVFFLIGLNVTKIHFTNHRKQISNKAELVFHAWVMFAISIIPSFAPSFILSSVISLFIYPALASAIKSKNLLTIILIYLAYIVINLNTFTKLEVLSILIVTIVSIVKYYNFHKQNKFMFFIFIVVGVLLMLEMFDLKSYLQSGGTFLSYIQGGYLNYNIETSFLQSGNITWNFNNKLVVPYMYLTTPWTNLQYVMETQNNLTFGLWFLKPLLGWLQLDGFFLTKYNLQAYSSFNTFTYLAVIFKDVGYWGSLLISLFLGFFVKLVYNRFLFSRSPLDIASYALVSLATFQMFFSNHFFMLSYPFTIIVISAIYQFVFVKYDYQNRLSDSTLLGKV